MQAAGVELNDVQVRALRWIAEGCPDGVMEGTTHKISAAALRNRDLVRTKGHGKAWSARVTDRGRDYLRRLDAPPAADARDETRRSSRAPGDRVGSVATATSSKPVKEPRLSKTEQLVADVVAAGGTLRVPDETQGAVNFRRRAYAAQRHGKVPDGKHLAVSRVGNEFEIALRDGAPPPEPVPEQPEPELRVPEVVRRYHPVAQTFRERTAIHEVSRAALPRVSRIIHAVALEVERRGHAIECVTPEQPDAYGRDGWSGSKHGQLRVSVKGHSWTLRIVEKGVGQRGSWEQARQRQQEYRDRGEYRWVGDRIEPYDKHATGQLDIEFARGRSWGDRKRWTLEDRLGDLLRTIEAYAEAAEQRRLEAERAAAERQRQWEEAMQQAKARFIAHHHTEQLRKRVRAWQEADAISAYCDALEARFGADVIAADPAASRWLAFARAHVERTQSLPRMSADPEPSPKDLEPFLGGVSPYGPRRW